MVNQLTAKSVLEEMFKSGRAAGEIIQSRGLGQINGASELEGVIAKVVEANPQAVKDFKAGKETAIKFLVGQVMRQTRGQADPKLAGELLEKKLKVG